MLEVELEDDAVPIVRIVGAMVRRSLTQPSVVKHLGRVKGVVALKSATDPQSVTIRLDGSTIRLARGVADDTLVTITADLADDRVKPKVTGATRHPALAMAVGKLLEPPVGSWQVEGERFLSAALHHDECPRPILVVATDSGQSQQWGGDGEPTIEIHGPSDRLALALSGGSVIAQDVLDKKLQIVGDLRNLSLLTRLDFDHVFGELA